MVEENQRKDQRMYSSWDDLQEKIAKWSSETFGDKQGDPSIIFPKLLEEIEELKENTNDIIEFADCIMILLDIAYIKGISASEIYKAMEKKYLINCSRTWHEEQDGIIKHD